MCSWRLTMKCRGRKDRLQREMKPISNEWEWMHLTEFEVLIIRGGLVAGAQGIFTWSHSLLCKSLRCEWWQQGCICKSVFYCNFRGEKGVPEGFSSTELMNEEFALIIMLMLKEGCFHSTLKPSWPGRAICLIEKPYLKRSVMLGHRCIL